MPATRSQAEAGAGGAEPEVAELAQFGSDGSISSLRRRGGALRFPLLSAAFVRSSALGVERQLIWSIGCLQ